MAVTANVFLVTRKVLHECITVYICELRHNVGQTRQLDNNKRMESFKVTSSTTSICQGFYMNSERAPYPILTSSQVELSPINDIIQAN